MIETLIIFFLSFLPAKQVGWATWYGDGNYHGDITANGEKFDPLGKTCASRSIPLNTYVVITNGYSLSICRVNDRGPYGAIVNGEWVVMFRRGGFWHTRINGATKTFLKRPGNYRGIMDLSLGTARGLYGTNGRPPNGNIRVYTQDIN